MNQPESCLDSRQNKSVLKQGNVSQVTSLWHQCCGSKYIEFGPGYGSRILAQFGSGSRVMLSILKQKFKNNFREKLFSLQKYRYIFFKEQNVT